VGNPCSVGVEAGIVITGATVAEISETTGVTEVAFSEQPQIGKATRTSAVMMNQEFFIRIFPSLSILSPYLESEPQATDQGIVETG